MSDERSIVRQISWRDLAPWLLIFRTFTLALAIPLLFVATIGVMVQPIGWRVAELFLTDDDLSNPAMVREINYFGRWPGSEGRYPVRGDRMKMPFWQMFPYLVSGEPLVTVFNRIASPIRELFDRNMSVTKFCYYLFGGLWTVALWALVGGIITRYAVVYLGREERVGLKDAAIFVGKKYLTSYLAAPLYPLIGVVLLTIPLALLGLLMNFNFGVVVAGILWIFVLLAALAMTFLLVGLLFGWPLMWPTIGAENGDAFEALSRSYGYTFQRPFHYLFYVMIAGILGVVAWWIVALLATGVIELALWGVNWGMGAEQQVIVQRAILLDPIPLRPAQPPAPPESGMLWAGAGMIRFFNGIVYCTALGFGYSFFFCAASAIYLLLRQVDDETELDEVYLDEEGEKYTLPDLKKPAASEVAAEAKLDTNEAE